MKKWTLLEQASAPDGSQLSLAEHDGTYAIRVNGRELMSSRHSHSEEQLGVVGCEALRFAKGARVLIGGLGLGFTLRAALATLARDARVLVAELLPEVVAWNRNPAYALASAALADPRTQVVIEDVAHVIEDSKACFDAILLDADNQTTRMNTEGNARLYRTAGLSSVHRALSNGGTVVYWSAAEEPAFVQRFARAGFQVEVRRVARHPGARASHFLLIGRRVTVPPPR